YEEIDKGYVAFGGNPKGGKITRKDHLGKFDGKADEGFFARYFLNSKAFRVFNSRTRIVEENLHIRFSESLPNVVGSGPDWLFDIDALTRTMNYEPIFVCTQSNDYAGIKASDNAGQARKSSHDDGFKPSSDDGKKVDEDPRNENDDIVADMNNMDTTIQVSIILTTRIHKDHPLDQVIRDLHSATQTRQMSKNLEEHGTRIVEENLHIRFSETIPDVVGTQYNGFVVNVVGGKINIELPFDLNMPALEDVGIFNFSSDHKDDGAMADMNNLDTTIQEEPKKVIHALKNPSWIEAMQEELLQFKIQEVWTFVDHRKRAIGSKWVFKNKKDEKRNVIRNKARLVAQGYTQEEGIDYDEVFSFAFLYGKIKEEVYVCQPPRFKDPDFSDRVYKVEKALYRLHQAPRAWYETLLTYLFDNRFQRRKIEKTLFIKRHKGDILLVQVYADDIIFGSTKKELCIAFEKMMHEKFQMNSMGELTFFLGLQVKQKKGGTFVSLDKYVAKILKKLRFPEVKTASTPLETQKPLFKDEDVEELDVHMYGLMIGLLKYLTSSRPDIMFAVYAYARYQVNLKISHLYVVKRIFRYLKGQPKLGLWYPKDSLFDLVAYTDSDYARARLDRKSTTG
nr:hypothetical protein [Tanacetum cinerariifolium]